MSDPPSLPSADKSLFITCRLPTLVEMNKTGTEPAEGSLLGKLGAASHSLLARRSLGLVERPAAWQGGPLPRKLRGEDLRGGPRFCLLPACLPARGPGPAAGASFSSAALARRPSPVVSSPAQALSHHWVWGAPLRPPRGPGLPHVICIASWVKQG